MNKGSQWRKWDLHIHTPESFQQEFRFDSDKESEHYDGDIWEKFVTELEQLQDFAVIGITDYFCIEGYRKILDYKQEGRLANISLFLPNIEFRLDRFLAKDAEKRLNFHVIFSDELDPDLIESEFLQGLDITDPKDEKRTLNKQNIEEIGRTLKEQHAKFQHGTDFQIGCMNINVSLGQILEILGHKKSLFGGKYLLVLPEENWCEIGWDGQDHLTRKQLFVRSDALFSSNPNTRDWALGKKEVSEEKFLEEFLSLKPCIHGSDAHTFDRICKPDLDRFCWIKADPTFEGLKQICYEPEARVRVQEQSPEPRKNIYTLNTLGISNSKISDELEIFEQVISLNSNLVAVIGGKGSGKTAALDAIANCFQDRCKRSGIDQNSFIQRVEDQKPDLGVALTFMSGDQFVKAITDESFFTTSQITHLPQGKIEEYSSDQSKLHSKISDIINSNKAVIESGYKEQLDDCLEDYIASTIELDEVNTRIIALEKKTSHQIIFDLNSQRQLLEGRYNNKADELKQFIEGIGEDEKDKVETLKKEENKLLSLYVTHKAAENRLSEIEAKLTELEALNDDMLKLNHLLKEVGVPDMIPPLKFDEQVKAIGTIGDYLTKRITDIYSTREDIVKKLDELSGLEKTHADLLKEITDIKEKLETVEKELGAIAEKKQQISQLEEARKDCYAQQITTHCDSKCIYDRIIDVFSAGKDTILENIDFSSSIIFKKDNFEEMAEDIFDLRKVKPEAIDSCSALIGNMFSNYPDIQPYLEEYLSEALKLREYLKQARSTSDLYKWIFGGYFYLGTEVYFGGIHMDKLSIGQKGTVLLKILLAEGDYPLIIDQPEENLDNKFIYEFLVDAFRKAKERRQIIIATHNANLVVNTDAEQTIIAEFEGNRISYKSGSIENTEIRQGITTLLEGGEEAFRKREAKYGYA